MNILIVDESKAVRASLIKYLELEKRFEFVFEVSTVKEAKRVVQSIQTDVILLDIQLHDQSGLVLMNYCSNLIHKPVIIVCSNYGLPQYKNIYEKFSISRFFDKSSELSELKRFIKNLTPGSSYNLNKVAS